MTIRLAVAAGTRNGMPPSAAYVYRGTKRTEPPARRNLITLNEDILGRRGPAVPETSGLCRSGHAMSRTRPDGRRRCLACDRARRQATRRKETTT